jgi:hypothetical protein
MELHFNTDLVILKLCINIVTFFKKVDQDYEIKVHLFEDGLSKPSLFIGTRE